ncbi:MAG TPA: ribulokinase [Bacteroidota bacterium]|nr:ribulokinase [Bacteroidota bacterium]
MHTYAIGLDFGTNSCRSLIVDCADGREIASHVFGYPSGTLGVIVDPSDPMLARQNPRDYLLGVTVTITEALKKASAADPSFSAERVIGIGVDTTGSCPMPVDTAGMPLCYDERFAADPASMVWLWKDHTSHAEAAQITETGLRMRAEFLAKVGGTYSSEWFWSKVLHCKRTSPEVYAAAHSFVEICDWIPAVLCGETKPELIKRSVCAAGHKAFFNADWGGLPDAEFLETLSPGLGSLRARLYDKAYAADERAGFLSSEWCAKLGLGPNPVAVAVGSFDAHMGAVGAGVSPGTLVKIMGTSTCDIMIAPSDEPLSDIKGVCGIVKNSVMNGYYGIEAGQSAVGDIFLWFVSTLVPESWGATPDEKFKNLEIGAGKLKPGESGLLALDWNNGNRTVLVDARLTGLLLGQTLSTRVDEIYRALIEATAFGALTIIDRIESYGVKISEIVTCGGLASKNPVLMQIYADITGRPMKISRSDQTPALGAAIFASVAAGTETGGHASVAEASAAMTGVTTVYEPNAEHHATYEKLYALYTQLHDAFGTRQDAGSLYSVMKSLLDIRDAARSAR